MLDQRIIADPASTGNAVIVATADRHVRALAARDLSPVGSWPLDAPLAGRPIGIGETALSWIEPAESWLSGAMASGPGRSSSTRRSSGLRWSSINWSGFSPEGKLHVLAPLEWPETRAVGTGRLAERRAAHGGQTGAGPGRQGVSIRPVAALARRRRIIREKSAWERSIP